MHRLLFVWMCVFAVLPATGHWVHIRGLVYTVYNTKLDFVTSMERCLGKDAKMATFPPAYNFTKLITSMRLETNTRYWLAVGKLDESFKTCFALFILQNRHKWRLRNINCSASYEFICEREPTPLDLKHHGEPAISVAPTDDKIRPTKQSSIITTSPVCMGSSNKCGKSTAHATIPVLEPSFTNNMIHPMTLPPSLIQLTRRTSPASHAGGILETTPRTAMENTEHIHATKQLPASAITEYSVTGNKQRLCSLCHERCPSYRSKPDNGTDNVSYVIDVDVLNVSLVIDVKDTNRYRRQRTSAHDPRPSSRAMGVAAVIVIATVMLCIMAMDMPHVLHNIHVMTGGDRHRRPTKGEKKIAWRIPH